MSCICFYQRNCFNYQDLYNNIHFLNKAREHLEQYLEICTIRQQSSSLILSSSSSQAKTTTKAEQQQLNKQMTPIEINDYLNAINLQIEVTKFINNCIKEYNKVDLVKDFMLSQQNNNNIKSQIPNLFGNNDTKINLCCIILLSGQSIQEGFGFVIRIIQVCLKSN